MATTYDSSASSAKDKARLLLGDTNPENVSDGWIFTDEEITSFLTIGFNEGVAQLALSAASRFAQYPDEEETPGDHRMKWSERVKNWRELAKQMRSSIDPTGAITRRNGRVGAIKNPATNKIRNA